MCIPWENTLSGRVTNKGVAAIYGEGATARDFGGEILKIGKYKSKPAEAAPVDPTIPVPGTTDTGSPFLNIPTVGGRAL